VKLKGSLTHNYLHVAWGPVLLVLFVITLELVSSGSSSSSQSSSPPVSSVEGGGVGVALEVIVFFDAVIESTKVVVFETETEECEVVPVPPTTLILVVVKAGTLVVGCTVLVTITTTVSVSPLCDTGSVVIAAACGAGVKVMEGVNVEWEEVVVFSEPEFEIGGKEVTTWFVASTPVVVVIVDEDVVVNVIGGVLVLGPPVGITTVFITVTTSIVGAWVYTVVFKTRVDMIGPPVNAGAVVDVVL
jgi:hypothetical protein